MTANGDSNVRSLPWHPSVAAALDRQQLRARLLEVRIRQQLVLTWVLGLCGGLGVLALIGVVVGVWRIALTV